MSTRVLLVGSRCCASDNDHRQHASSAKSYEYSITRYAFSLGNLRELTNIYLEQKDVLVLC